MGVLLFPRLAHQTLITALALLMVLGRLELYAVLVLFLPAAWRKY